MSKECAITGKSTKMAGGYSNTTRATQFNPTGKVRRKANIHKHRIFVPELKKNFILNISTKGLKILHKKGPFKALKDAKII